MNKKSQFKKYSDNLDLVLSSFDKEIKLRPRHEGGNYICPLGFTNHSIDCLGGGNDNQLSIEHSPPESLGGKPICLVERELNNKSGYQSDITLLRYIESLQFKRGENPALVKLYLGLPKLKSPKVLFHIDSEKRINLIPRNISLNNHIDETIFKNDYRFSFEFRIQEMNQSIKNLILKIGYLHAFNRIGYILLFGPKTIINEHYQKVRNQILTNDKEIIPIAFEFSKFKKFEGVAIINDPKECASIMVGYSLTLNGITDYVTVILPAPDSRGFNPLNKILQGKQDLKFKILPEIEFWKNRENACFFYDFWKYHNGIV